MRSRLVAVGVLVAGVVAVVSVVRGSAQDHVLHARFSSVTDLVSGNEVRMGGLKVGSVGAIDLRRDGKVDVALEIADGRVWPLRRGTEARIDFGATASYSNRHVELLPGPRSRRPLASGATIADADTQEAVEYDDLFNIFEKPTRQDVRRLLASTAATFGPRARSLRAGLHEAAPAFGQVAELFKGLGSDEYALRVLARSGHATAAAIAQRHAQLRDMIAAAGATFDEVARHAGSMRATLRRFPVMLRAARGTLGRVDRSLGPLDALVFDLRPGARAARSLSAPLRDAALALGRVAPQLDQTLKRVGGAAPDVSRFLVESRPLLDRLPSTLKRFAPMMGCLRPYAPEITGTLNTWASMSDRYDALGHTSRALVQSYNYGDTSTKSAAEQQRDDPNLGYALLRPPGYLVGDSWFNEDCGITPAGLDASKDPHNPGRRR